MKITCGVPLISQHWNLAHWQKLGFTSREDAEYWMESCCGILCVQEIATFFNDKPYSTIELIKQGQELDGYSHENGWKHDGLVRLLEKLGLGAGKKIMTMNDLKKALDQKKLPIVSIKWAFKQNKSLKEKLFFWKKYGGHLAVVIGYADEGFYINHTSKIAGENWKARLIPFDKFVTGYTGRAILVWKNF